MRLEEIMTTDEEAIRILVDDWMDASRAGDIAGVLELMSDDVVFMVPGRAPFGKAEFAESSKGMEGVQFEGRSDIVELKILGNWAWMRNHLRVTVTPPGGKPVIRSGYALTVLRKNADGDWMITRDANLMTLETGSS
jgi:uncharacterized protein (TIGR02246 family)